MKIARYQVNGQVAWGSVLPADQIAPFSDVITQADLFERDLLNDTDAPLDINQVRLLAPIEHPEKIICIGKNYADHAKEMGGEPPEVPVVFSKFSSALIGPGDAVECPSISEQVDYEAELVVVIGKEGRNISNAAAMEHVFGYTCGNDISARDWQKGKPGGQWLLGKAFDTFAPLGPWIVTADEIANPHQLDIEMRVNGIVKQSANTALMIYSIPYLIAHLSQFFTLRPGDLIFTGTPAGVGAGSNPPSFLKPGDQVQVTIASIGTLKNPIA